MKMEYEEYRDLYNSLNCTEDIGKLEARGYDHQLLETLLTQKTSRDVKKRFYTVKKKTPQMLREWKKGTSLMELSKKYLFPPILTAMFVFMEDGASKKEFWSYVREPDQLNDVTAAELREVISNDLVYSTEGNEKQRQRGIWGEGLLQEWLDGQGISYRTENDLRGEFGKTPDCLLDEPMMYNGRKIHWIESKASFGDNTEFRFNCRKQLSPYTELFGPGVVVYWIGCLDDLECPPGVYVSDISILQNKLETIKEEE
ncbi:MAG: C15orf41 family protein [Candidatus Methanomethylophilaceae archaeon]|jgi:hypothetical protein|nr:C15orf41 family protein [Candidatus Methanomethylophilaceae archaeon]